MIKVHERRKNLDQAIHLCNQIVHLKLDKAAETIGLGSYSPDNDFTLQVFEFNFWFSFKYLFQILTDELTHLQTTIYGYVNELAENNDLCLEEVLNINDQINKALPERDTPKGGNRAPASERVHCEFTTTSNFLFPLYFSLCDLYSPQFPVSQKKTRLWK